MAAPGLIGRNNGISLACYRYCAKEWEGLCARGKSGQAAQESAAKQEAERPAPHRGGRVVETEPVDRAIKDAVEDDEVREALNLRGRNKRR